VKLDGFGGAAEAKAILLDAIKRYEESSDKPNF
jgi:inorganic pyrophosphatase